MTILEATIKNSVLALTSAELIELASCMDTPADMLDKLSRNPYYIIRAHVAYNPNTSVQTLIKLSGDRANVVREYTMLNRKTPVEIARKLLADVDWAVVAAAKIKIKEMCFYERSY